MKECNDLGGGQYERCGLIQGKIIDWLRNGNGEKESDISECKQRVWFDKTKIQAAQKWVKMQVWDFVGEDKLMGHSYLNGQKKKKGDELNGKGWVGQGG